MAQKTKNANIDIRQSTRVFYEQAFVGGGYNDDYILAVGNRMILDRKQSPDSMIRKKSSLMTKFLIVIFLFLSPSVGAQTGITIDNELFFRVVIPLINKGHTATILAKGKSMIPFICDGDKVLLEKYERYKNGDVVLAHLSEGRYVLHRIVSLHNDSVALMGDGNLYGREYCPVDSLKALCRTMIGKKGNKISLDTDIQKSRVELWHACLSKREALLSSFTIPDDTFWENLFLSCIKLDRDIKVTIRPCYEIKEFEQEKNIISTESSNVDFSSLISLNESAEFLFNKMKGQNLCLDEVVGILLQEYDVEKSTATNDCLDLLTKWFSLGILKIVVV